jgi:hypothetical protein
MTSDVYSHLWPDRHDRSRTIRTIIDARLGAAADGVRTVEAYVQVRGGSADYLDEA